MKEEIHLYWLQLRIWTKGRNCKKMVINNQKIAKPCAKVSEKLYTDELGQTVLNEENKGWEEV